MRRLNLTEDHNQERHHRRPHKKNFFKRFFSWGSLLAAVILVAIGWYFFTSPSSVLQVNFLPVSAKPQPERINFLLLGNAGGTHDGAELTDSIIVASYDLKTNKVLLISVPRDLWLDSIKNKVNAAYEIGQEKKNGGNGLKYAEDKIDDILGTPIDYGLRIDFSGFAKAIDLVGGVDVDVPKTFDDYEFPIAGKEDDLCGYKEEERDFTDDQLKALNLPSPLPPDLQNFGPEPLQAGKKKVLIAPDGNVATAGADFNCRFKHVSFKKGMTHMDGQTALDFVRSRKGNNGEGSDFARSRRQQLVIQSFREKVLSVQTLVNPGKIAGLLSTFGQTVETDIPADKYLEFYNLSKKAGQVESIVLGDLDGGKSVLINPPVSDYGAWVLIPPKNDFTPIKDFIKQKLIEQASPSATTK